MSIICGIFERDGKPIQSEDKEKVENAVFRYDHDKKGIFYQDNILFGQSLHYNSNESLKEDLPSHDTQSGLVICADCRIDNREELGKKLCSPVHSNITDSSLVLKAYEKYGRNCVKHLIGAFAFAIWDEKKRELYIARDHLGVRPLFYYQKDKLFAFGTDKGLVLSYPRIDHTKDRDFLENFALNLPAEEFSTFYQHIRVFPPAHYIIINASSIRIERYWQLETPQRIIYQKDEEYVEHFQDLLQQSVISRIRSARQVGAELSGGLDSSGVSGFAHQELQHSGKSLYTYSNVMPDHLRGKVYPYEDENHLVDNFCEYHDIRNCYKISSGVYDGFLNNVDPYLVASNGLDEYPVGDRSSLTDLAQKHNVSVILSGFMGDELVSSFCRPYFLDYLRKNQLIKFIKHAKKRLGWTEVISYPFYNMIYQFSPFIAEQIVSAGMSLRKPQNFLERRLQRSTFKPSYVKSQPHLWNKIRTRSSISVPVTLEEYHISKVLRSRTHKRMESENRAALLIKAERRYPLADIRLMQFVLSVPMEQKFNPLISRFLYRRAVKNRIPENMRLRNDKFGAVSPYLHHSFCQSLDERISWLNGHLDHPKFQAFDIQRWIEIARGVANFSHSSSKWLPVSGQRRIVQMLRYFESNPEENLFTDN